jgi:hypothetical protein
MSKITMFLALALGTVGAATYIWGLAEFGPTLRTVLIEDYGW